MPELNPNLGVRPEDQHIYSHGCNEKPVLRTIAQRVKLGSEGPNRPNECQGLHTSIRSRGTRGCVTVTRTSENHPFQEEPLYTLV